MAEDKRYRRLFEQGKPVLPALRTDSSGLIERKVRKKMVSLEACALPRRKGAQGLPALTVDARA